MAASELSKTKDDEQLIKIEISKLSSEDYIRVIICKKEEEIEIEEVAYTTSVVIYNKDEILKKMFNSTLSYDKHTKQMTMVSANVTIHKFSKPVENQDFIKYFNQFREKIELFIKYMKYYTQKYVINFKNNISLTFNKLYNCNKKLISTSILWEPKLLLQNIVRDSINLHNWRNLELDRLKYVRCNKIITLIKYKEDKEDKEDKNTVIDLVWANERLLRLIDRDVTYEGPDNTSEDYDTRLEKFLDNIDFINIYNKNIEHLKEFLGYVHETVIL